MYLLTFIHFLVNHTFISCFNSLLFYFIFSAFPRIHLLCFRTQSCINRAQGCTQVHHGRGSQPCILALPPKFVDGTKPHRPEEDAQTYLMQYRINIRRPERMKSSTFIQNNPLTTIPAKDKYFRSETFHPKGIFKSMRGYLLHVAVPTNIFRIAICSMKACPLVILSILFLVTCQVDRKLFDESTRLLARTFSVRYPYAFDGY